MDEIWRTIPGYDGKYEASSEGHIRRVSGKATRPGQPKLLKPFKDERLGYIRISIIREGKLYRPGLHVLVASAFLGECPDKHEVNHIDMDKSNNRPGNLEYATHPENLRQARLQKDWGHISKTRALTDEQVRDIRQKQAPQRVLAEKYGISQVAIVQVQHYRTYKEVTDF